jgi:hypothetical protein
MSVVDDYATTNRTFSVAVSTARSFSFLSALADRHVGPLRVSLAFRSVPAHFLPSIPKPCSNQRAVLQTLFSKNRDD